MSNFPHVEPVIGHWYHAKIFPESFVVISQDEDDYIEVQYHDGEIDRIDPEEWNAVHPHEIAEPEDAAPFDENYEADMLNLLNQIESQEDLEEHLHHLDRDELH